jgi:hypothetical protein
VLTQNFFTIMVQNKKCNNKLRSENLHSKKKLGSLMGDFYIDNHESNDVAEKGF